MNTGIELVQNPIIKQNLVETGKSVTKRLKDLNIDNQVATIDTVKSLKDLRADLNKELAEFETQRKFIKESVLSPYNEFEALYKTEISEKYKSAIDTIKDKIAIVEDKIKLDKKNAVMAYFNELCLSEKIDFLTFENVGLEINISTTEKKYREQCNEYVQRVVDDLALIDTQEFKAEILVEYKSTLNASRAIKAVQDRKEKERIERERLRLMEIEKRINILKLDGFKFDEMFKMYEFDQDISISEQDLQELTKEDFGKRLMAMEISIQKKQREAEEARREAQRIATDNVQAAQQVQIHAENATPVVEVYKAEPLAAPVVEAPKEVAAQQTFKAAFEIDGTKEQIYSVRDFLISNNIKYRNV